MAAASSPRWRRRAQKLRVERRPLGGGRVGRTGHTQLRRDHAVGGDDLIGAPRSRRPRRRGARRRRAASTSARSRRRPGRQSTGACRPARWPDCRRAHGGARLRRVATPVPGRRRGRRWRRPPRRAASRGRRRRNAPRAAGRRPTARGRTSRAPADAPARPAAPATAVRTAHSISSCCTRRPRVAPSAVRIAISSTRNADRAKSSVAAVAQPMASTMAAAPSSASGTGSSLRPRKRSLNGDDRRREARRRRLGRRREP